jgi:hypothetical protein
MCTGARLNRAVLAFAVVAFAFEPGCATHQRLVRQDEGVIIADLRAIQSAEAAFQSANMGYYGTLQCLAAPADCLDRYPSDAPPFLSKPLAGLTPEDGYLRRFFAGPEVPEAMRGGAAATSITAWAYTAVPAQDLRGQKGLLCGQLGKDLRRSRWQRAYRCGRAVHVPM